MPKYSFFLGAQVDGLDEIFDLHLKSLVEIDGLLPTFNWCAGTILSHPKQLKMVTDLSLCLELMRIKGGEND